MELRRVTPLQRGDRVAIVSPSSHLNAACPHRLEAATRALGALGLEAVVVPDPARDARVHRPAALRAQELCACFEDETIAGIVCSLGGFSANEVLRHLDYALIRAKPKVFCGYSDITLLHAAITTRCGFETFYGPAALTQLAEPTAEVFSYMEAAFKRAVMASGAIGRVQPSAVWTDEFLDWFTRRDQERARQTLASRGHVWVRGGQAQGALVGGCLPSLLQLKGTAFDLEYDGKVLFLDIPEGHAPDAPTPLVATRAQLFDLELAGVLARVRGVIVGRPVFYDDAAVSRFEATLAEVFAPYDYPVLSNANIGHVDPIITLPYGRACLLDSATDRWEIS